MGKGYQRMRKTGKQENMPKTKPAAEPKFGSRLKSEMNAYHQKT
jgi:hypothetical protein